jgi:hypothetical protein
VGLLSFTAALTPEFLWWLNASLATGNEKTTKQIDESECRVCGNLEPWWLEVQSLRERCWGWLDEIERVKSASSLVAFYQVLLRFSSSQCWLSCPTIMPLDAARMLLVLAGFPSWLLVAFSRIHSPEHSSLLMNYVWNIRSEFWRMNLRNIREVRKGTKVPKGLEIQNSFWSSLDSFWRFLPMRTAENTSLEPRGTQIHVPFNAQTHLNSVHQLPLLPSLQQLPKASPNFSNWTFDAIENESLELNCTIILCKKTTQKQEKL